MMCPAPQHVETGAVICRAGDVLRAFMPRRLPHPCHTDGPSRSFFMQASHAHNPARSPQPLYAMTGRNARIHANGTRGRLAQNEKTGMTSV